jgi:hypothetical protein
MPIRSKCQEFVAFLTIFNEMKYAQNPKVQLTLQKIQERGVTVVENTSTDNSFEVLASTSKSSLTTSSLVNRIFPTIRMDLFYANVRIYSRKEPTHYWDAHWR